MWTPLARLHLAASLLLGGRGTTIAKLGGPCSIEGCVKPVIAKALCGTHYAGLRRTGTTDHPQAAPLVTCAVSDCDKAAAAKGYCKTHYLWWWKTGEPDPQRRRQMPERGRAYEGCDSTHYVGGYCRKHKRRIDKHGSADIVKVGARPRTGSITSQGYLAVTVGDSGFPPVLEHRHVMSLALGRPLLPEENVHHLNGDRADNRLENLKLWSKFQPPGKRVSDKVIWASDLLALCAPELLSPAGRAANSKYYRFRILSAAIGINGDLDGAGDRDWPGITIQWPKPPCWSAGRAASSTRSNRPRRWPGGLRTLGPGNGPTGRDSDQRERARAKFA